MSVLPLAARPLVRPAPARRRPLSLALLVLALLPAGSRAQALTDTERAKVDSIARGVLMETGAPSASVAVVRGGVIAYEQAYGTARINPDVAASPQMRYAIGSVSKQFTATAILLLAEEGKLKLDDPVSRYLPGLTRGTDVTIRQLLSMTSGYQDYWPQDYVMVDMQRPVTAREIMQRWAAKPLDFEPGSKWQYSNTNYVLAGAIVEKVSRMAFLDFLKQRIFTPLGMTTVANYDAGPLSAMDAAPLLRNGLGPLRLAPKEGPGWLFAAGQLAMTAHDLALWDIGIMDQKVLKPASYRAQQTDMLLTSGLSTGYGLGVDVSQLGEHRRISHTGAVSGYTTSNQVFPEARAAVVVFTNIYPGGGGASSRIGARVASMLFAPADTAGATALADARAMYDELTKGRIDRSRLTVSANAYFTDEVLADYAASLGPLGAPSAFTRGGESLRGGMVIRSYRIAAGGRSLALTTMTMPDGKIEQYIVEKVN
ncbi:MAG: beta-lactamase family protein [Gemmatimonadetes bacterium]|nr:beta-lactamase family protein [Gemmatimonadota bacterium]